MEQRCDAIIVGAGPAGSTLAALLARAGWEVVLLDAGRFPRPKVCGECLSVAALPVLVELGLDRAVRDAAILARSLRIVLPRGATLELMLHEDGLEGVLGISRHKLDWLLLQNAIRCQAHVMLEQRVREVLFDSGRVSGVSLGSASEDSRTLRSRIVIAADGRASTIVRQTGRVSARGPRLVGFKSHRPSARSQNRSPDSSATIDMVSLRGGYVGTCNVEEGEQNICGLLPRAAVQQARGSIDAALGALMREYDSSLMAANEDRPAGRWQTIAEVRQQQATPRAEGVLYVGDALGTIEPLAGQGLAMALRGAQLAAELLLEEPSREINAALQQRYATLWQRNFRTTIRRARRLGWWLRHPAALNSLARLAPASERLEELLLRACYRQTRLQPLVRGNGRDRRPPL